MLYIAQLDDSAKRLLLKSVAERGKAAGLEGAAAILTEIVAGRNGVIKIDTIKDLATTMLRKAAQIRRGADETIKALEADGPCAP